MNPFKNIKIKMDRSYAKMAKIVKIADSVIQRRQAVLLGITLKLL